MAHPRQLDYRAPQALAGSARASTSMVAPTALNGELQDRSPREPHPPLDTEAAAKQLGLSPRTLEKMRVYGGGPVFEKNGRRVFYDLDDLYAWRQRNKRFSTSDQGSGRHP
jgi:hypothetical protein